MTTDTAVQPVTVDDLDLFSDDVLLNTRAIQDELRELAPVVHLPACDLWAITRYDDIRGILSDPSSFSSQKVAFNDTMNDIMVGTTIATDPPDHKQLRDALMENLTPRALRGLKGEMEAKGVAHVRSLAGRGAFDGHADFARDFVLSVVVDMIGVQGEERDMLLTWAEAALNAQGPLNERGRAGLPVAGGMFAWTRGRLAAADLREGSIGRGIFAAADRGEIPYENRSILIEQIVVAGMETTIAALSNAIILLGRNPEQYRMLRQDPTLIASAFAEVLRMTAARSCPQARRSPCCSRRATTTRATTRIRRDSMRPAIRPTTSLSATARTAAQGRGSHAWNRTRCSQRSSRRSRASQSAR
jgi:cytochrome P450